MSSENGQKQTSMFSSEELPANHLASQACGKEWKTPAETWPSRILQWLSDFGPAGWYGKTSAVSCPPMKDGTLAPSSQRWLNSGIAQPGECLTLNTSEFPSDVVESSLSHILETGDLPQKYYLSATACAGILRRAAERRKTLAALEDVVAAG